MEKNNIEIRAVSGRVSIGSFKLDSGLYLDNVTLAYERCGPKNAPVILLCHALTGSQYAFGSSRNPGWWRAMIGRNQAIDTEKFQVISFNVLGGCNGSTGPTSINRKTGKPYLSTFPHITIRDMVKAQARALEALGIRKLHAVMGGSLGGMQVLEWGIMFPSIMKKLFAFAVTPYLSDYGIAFNRIAIEAIRNDPNWQNGNYKRSSDVKGLEVARMVGMVTYRSAELYSDRFSRTKKQVDISHPLYEVECYLKHQGKKLSNRFDVNSYLTLLYAMNDHDLGKERGGLQKAIKRFKADLYLFGYENDLIYPPKQIKIFGEKMEKSHFYEISTRFGHDGFLVEFDKWGKHVKSHLEE